MTVETWKAEFYPKPVRQTTVEEAAEHSLQKWRGYLPESLEKHGISLDALEAAHFPYRAMGMCALCEHHYIRKTYNDAGLTICPGCPLSEIGQCCLGNDSAYELTNEDSSAEAVGRMVAALEQAVEWEDKNPRKEE